MKPTISIAMTTYNGGAYLLAQLESLWAQTGDVLEIVVSDDGSMNGGASTALNCRHGHG